MVDVKDMNKIAISLDLAKDVVTKDYMIVKELLKKRDMRATWKSGTT